MLRILSSTFSFLTIIPVGEADLKTSARYMHLFPLVGIVLGLIFGSIGFGLSLFLDPLMVGFIVVTSIVIITGAHHVDGLADFADGLMVRGSKEKKIAAMRDLTTGTAGTVSIVLCMLGLTVALSRSGGDALFLAILVGEIMAKFSMVLLAGISRPAVQGTGSLFISSMTNRTKLFSASLITVIPITILGGVAGLTVFGVGIMVTMLLAALSARSFGGITGDVLGATNELTRLVSIMVFVMV